MATNKAKPIRKATLNRTEAADIAQALNEYAAACEAAGAARQGVLLRGAEAFARADRITITRLTLDD